MHVCEVIILELLLNQESLGGICSLNGRVFVKLRCLRGREEKKGKDGEREKKKEGREWKEKQEEIGDPN